MRPNAQDRAESARMRGLKRLAPVVERLEARALLATVYVDASNLAANPDGSQANPYRQIQVAINSAALNDAAADTIKIAAGVYRENVLVTRAVRLEGPNASSAPGTPRGPEAVLLPAKNNPNAGRNIVVEANNVQIAGLLIDGHSDTLSGGDVFNGISINASSGISNVDSSGALFDVSGLLVENNVIRNFKFFGFLADGGDPSDPASISTGNTIRGNTIDHIPFIASSPIQSDQGRGISIEHNFLADVSGNVITRAATGIQIIYSLVTPPAGQLTQVRDNVISYYDRGIFVYTMDSGKPAFVVTGNKVTTEATGATATNIGIDVDRVLDVTTGTIANNDVTGASIGIRLDYNWTSSGLTVTGGTLAGNGYGVVLTNVNPISSSSGPKAVKAKLAGVTIKNSTIAGLKVENALLPTAAAVSLTVDAATTLTGNARGAVVTGGASAKLIETTAPVVALTSTPGSQSSSSTASFGYTTSDNISSAGDLLLQYSLDGGAFVAAGGNPVNLSGLVAGGHSFVLRATDQAGNVGSASYSWTVTSSNPPPPAPSTPALAAAGDTGPSASDGITSNRTPTFGGTAPSNSTVTLFAGPTRLGSTTADSLGNWSFTVGGAGALVASLSDGTYAITATATTAAGTSLPSSPRSITIDGVPPTLAITSGPPLQTSATTATFAFTATDPAPSSSGVVLQYVLDGTTFPVTASPINLTKLALGSHTFVLKATDLAGNVATATYSWTVASSPPPAPNPPSTPGLRAISDWGDLDDDDITSDNTPTFNGTAPASSVVKLYAGSTYLGSTTAGSNGAWEFTVGGTGSSGVMSLADGAYAITATSTNSAGVTSAPSGIRPVVIDTKAPIIVGTRTPPPNAAGWNNGNVVVSYTASDERSGLSSSSPATGSFTFSSQGSGQSRTFTVKDVAGNTASVTLGSVNIDMTLPTLTLQASLSSLSPADGRTVSVSFSGSITDALSGIVDGLTYTLADSYGILSASGAVAIDASGNYSFTQDLVAQVTGQVERVYTITVSGTDAAGNRKSATVNVRVPLA